MAPAKTIAFCERAWGYELTCVQNAERGLWDMSFQAQIGLEVTVMMIGRIWKDVLK